MMKFFVLIHIVLLWKGNNFFQEPMYGSGFEDDFLPEFPKILGDNDKDCVLVKAWVRQRGDGGGGREFHTDIDH